MMQIPFPAGARFSVTGSEGLTLDALRPGERARVVRVGGAPEVRRRLLEMGFVSGTPVRVVRLAPFGDPMQIELHGYHISLRRSEARTVLVEPA